MSKESVKNWIIKADNDLKTAKDELNTRIHELTVYATELRYPEFFHIPSQEEAESAIEIAEKVKEFVKNKLEESGL